MITVIGECLAGGENIMVSAPTGSGKTITTLFPVLGHALRHDKRIFYLTAKNTQQDAVASNLQQLTGAEFPLKTIFLRARGQMCANDLYFCHGDYCSYAADSFNRIRQSGILEQLQAAGTILPQNIYTASTGRSLCPAEVQMALAGRSDLVVGDYNYIFDPAAALQSVFYRKPPGEWILVIDEAHNLYARAMERLSPSVSFNEIDALYRDLESRTARIYKKLADAIRTFRDILAGQYRDAAVYAPDRPVVLADPDGAHWRSAFDHFEQVYLQYLLHRIRYRQVVIDDPVEDFYFRLRYFVQILGTADTAFTPFFSAVNGGTLKIQCCDPSAYLGERIDQFHSVVALSATLEPMNWYRNALGFRKENTRTLQLAYPFSTARRRIIVVPGFDTRVKERHQNYPRYAEIIRNVVSIKPGNYIVFFPSFETLQTTNLFLGGLTATKLIQRSTMTAEEREELIAGLRAGDEPKVLLAVTGGIFAEGIDLPGAACIGVIIFGPSLPAVTPERELVRAYYDRSDEDGFLQAYVYPGMLRVIQAAGRLIRSDQDYGVLVLVGDRLADERFSALFPESWGDLTVTSDYQTPLIRFWQNFRT
jgi:DNA excision repair protein ERCC-2